MLEDLIEKGVEALARQHVLILHSPEVAYYAKERQFENLADEMIDIYHTIVNSEDMIKARDQASQAAQESIRLATL